MAINRDERPWVLIPGTLCTAEVFSAFLDAGGISEDHRIEVILSSPHVEDYLSELEDIVPEGAVICGFSLGAIVAAYYSERLKASELVLFGLNPRIDEPAKYDARRSLQNDVSMLGGDVALASRLPVLNGPSPHEARAKILKMAEESAEHIDAQTEIAITRPSTLGPLSKTTVPVTFLTGSEDSQTPSYLAHEALNVVSDGNFALLPGLGHYALVEDGKRCWNMYCELKNS